MKKQFDNRLAGSFTVEAACVMAMVLLAVSVMIHQAFRVHDETAGAMGLHESVEKGRHEKGADLNGIVSAMMESTGGPMLFSQYDAELEFRGSYIAGSGQGGNWSHEIEAKPFRPETFLRRITLIENLGEKDGD